MALHPKQCPTCDAEFNLELPSPTNGVRRFHLCPECAAKEREAAQMLSVHNPTEDPITFADLPQHREVQDWWND